MLLLATRNLLRNRRRSLITLLSIVFAAMLTSSVRFLIYGTFQETFNEVLGLSSGYVQIAAFGWGDTHSLERSLDWTPELDHRIRIPGVSQISPRIEANALLSFSKETRFAKVVAFDPAREVSVTDLERKLKEGVFLTTEGVARRVKGRGGAGRPIYQAVIGYRMARDLRLEVGRTITLVGSHFDGSVGAIEADIVGILQTNYGVLDSDTVFLSLPGGEDLFAPGDESQIRYTNLAIGLDDAQEADRIIDRLRKIFPVPAGETDPEHSRNYDPVVVTWQDLNQELVQLYLLKRTSNEVMLVFLLLVMAFGVLATVEMSLQERTREFGILLAIGTPPYRLVGVVMIEVGLLLMAGTALGLAIGCAGGYYLQFHPIRFTGALAQAMIDVGRIPVIRSIVDLTNIWISILTTTLPSALLSYLAVRRIPKMDPVQAIQTM